MRIIVAGGEPGRELDLDLQTVEDLDVAKGNDVKGGKIHTERECHI